VYRMLEASRVAATPTVSRVLVGFLECHESIERYVWDTRSCEIFVMILCARYACSGGDF